MTQSIDYFLECTATWTPRWFNKPKFHLIRHLPDHVRRFGPAILYATEAFESFNAVIRAHSVHSNRLAPSRDIAVGLAAADRIRHMLSGGLFLKRARDLDRPRNKGPFARYELPSLYRRSTPYARPDYLSIGKAGGDLVCKEGTRRAMHLADTLGVLPKEERTPGNSNASQLT